MRVTLGHTGDRSVAAPIYGLVQRGVGLRPTLAAAMSGTVVIRFAEPYAPVRIAFLTDTIVVEDDRAGEIADLEVNAALTDFVLCASAPLARGMPKPTTRHGLQALARIADGRVDFSGSLSLARKLLRLISVTPEQSP